MGFYYDPVMGFYHVNEAKPRKQVPNNERHKWNRKPIWGESATCLKCGCIKRMKRTLPDYTETYQMPGADEVSVRPACTGKATNPPTNE